MRQARADREYVAEEIDEAIHAVIERGDLASDIEVWLRFGEFEKADALLAMADPRTMEPSESLSVLTFAWHARDHLTNRAIFLARTEHHLNLLLGRDRTARLLENRR